MAVVRIVFRSPGILTIIDGPGQTCRVKFVPICLVSRGVPRADFILEHGARCGHFP